MRATIFEWLFLALIYVSTGGTVFTDWGKRHKPLVALAGLVALITTAYFLRDRYFEWFGGKLSSSSSVTADPPSLSADHIYWLTIKDAAVPELFEEFIRNFPSSSHLLEARERLVLITKQRAALASCAILETSVVRSLETTIPTNDAVSLALTQLRNQRIETPDNCPSKRTLFGGPVLRVQECRNDATFVHVGGPNAGYFLVTPSTKVYLLGVPRRISQWAIGVAGDNYYCLVSIEPIVVWQGYEAIVIGSTK